MKSSRSLFSRVHRIERYAARLNPCLSSFDLPQAKSVGRSHIYLLLLLLEAACHVPTLYVTSESITVTLCLTNDFWQTLVLATLLPPSSPSPARSKKLPSAQTLVRIIIMALRTPIAMCVTYSKAHIFLWLSGREKQLAKFCNISRHLPRLRIKVANGPEICT